MKVQLQHVQESYEYGTLCETSAPAAIGVAAVAFVQIVAILQDFAAATDVAKVHSLETSISRTRVKPAQHKIKTSHLWLPRTRCFNTESIGNRASRRALSPAASHAS